MAIRKITLREFNHLSSSGSGLASFIGDELEWFADDAVKVIGAIALGRGGQGCNYTILVRDEVAVSHVHGVRENLYNLKAARDELTRAMTAAKTHSGA